MLKGIWGRKIGMTQVFSDKNIVIPVTAIDLSDWVVTGIKTTERDGYNAVQVGCLRKRFADKPFDAQWLKKPKHFFLMMKEIKADDTSNYQIGSALDIAAAFNAGELVHVAGITKGRGFQGVVKRHDFRGGTASHGPRFGRWPGSMGFMRSQGRVIKGKKLPGHMGVANRVMRNLELVKIEPESKVALVKGSVPGHTGSLVFLQKV
jgi:large subunit ribosomal protein L3